MDMDMTKTNLNRRQFLKASTLMAAPCLLPARIWAAAGGTGPNDRIVMGFIGVGTQGRHLLNSFLPHPTVQIVAVCDVDTTRRAHHQKLVEDFYTTKADRDFKGCAEHRDFREVLARKEIDAVVIATPDHWHAYPAVKAAAGRQRYLLRETAFADDTRGPGDGERGEGKQPGVSNRQHATVEQ